MTENVQIRRRGATERGVKDFPRTSGGEFAAARRPPPVAGPASGHPPTVAHRAGRQGRTRHVAARAAPAVGEDSVIVREADMAVEGAGPARPRHRADAWAARLLTFSAGAVNALGFLALGGVFTSVVTANSALTGVALGGAETTLGVRAALAVVCYVLGAAAGSWTAARAHRGGRSRPAGFLLLELLLLWSVAGWWLAADGGPDAGQGTAVLGMLAAAMGCQNAGVRLTMGARAPTAYLTGLLTGAVAEALTARRVHWQALGNTTLLIVGATAATLLERSLHGAAPLLPALLVTAAWATVRAAPRPGNAARPPAPHRPPA